MLAGAVAFRKEEARAWLPSSAEDLEVEDDEGERLLPLEMVAVEEEEEEELVVEVAAVVEWE